MVVVVVVVVVAAVVVVSGGMIYPKASADARKVAARRSRGIIMMSRGLRVPAGESTRFRAATIDGRGARIRG